MFLNLAPFLIVAAAIVFLNEKVTTKTYMTLCAAFLACSMMTLGGDGKS
jgi:drug/metabolite transporter (DMT)-like permease